MPRATVSHKISRRVDRPTSAIVLLTVALWVLPQATRWRHEAMAETSPGYVLMVHATAEPHSHRAVDDTTTGNATLDQTKSGFSIANGAFTATRNDGSITFHAILYRADTVTPVVVSNPHLEVKALDSDRRLMFAPSLPASGNICHIETTWAGHEGPLDACTVYKLPVAAFNGMNAVTLTLHFADALGPQAKVHNAMAHGLLHMAIGGAPIDLRTVDATLTEPTPHFIESIIETKSM